VAPDTDTLITAALWHDLMKVSEYHIVGKVSEDIRSLKIPSFDKHTEAWWVKNEARVKLFGHHEHIIAGAMAFQKSAWLEEVNTDTIDAVTHCILAHHGRKEWGSPVEPQTIEALILSQADMHSAKFGATKEVAP
jgi:3'-5' exoribonuclease